MSTIVAPGALKTLAHYATIGTGGSAAVGGRGEFSMSKRIVHARFAARAVTAACVVAALVAAGAATADGAESAGDSTGVSAKEVKLGYIFSETGIAGSTFHNAGDAFQARIDRANAEGGVNGRKIVTEIIDDGGQTNNLQAAQELVRDRDVFAVVNNSPFAFLGYRFLLENGVPMIGGGYDGNEYGQPGNEDLISILGNTAPTYGVQYTGLPNVMKKLGGKRVAAVAYAISASSTAAAENLQKYAVPAVGLEAVYTNTTVDFGTTDVGPLVLAMKNAEADAVYLPMVASSNFAVITTAAQNNLRFKAAVLATGYGQDLLDQPIASQLGPEVVLAQGWAPVELKTKATKQFQADLKKYAGYEGVPDFGQYTGYIAADLAIKGLEAAGKNPTRQGFIDATKGLGTFDAAGMSCQPVDISRENFGEPAPQACGWYLQVKDGAFVPYPANGKPIVGKIIRKTVTATTTTTAPAG
jgi:branched-chain amino acid transport system substrate-binding protein